MKPTVFPAEQHSTAARLMRLARLLFALAILGMACLLLWRSGERLTALLTYPYSMDTLEGTLLYEARISRAGEPLYQAMELYRFVAAPYPPVHPLLLGWFDAISGPNIFWGGRLLSLCAVLGAALFALLTVRSTNDSWIGGIIAAGLLLAAPPVILWGSRIKPDPLALCWTAAGLWLATRVLAHKPRIGPITGKPDRSHIWLLAGAVIAFALALFTKQTAAAAPLAAGIAFLSADWQDWRQGARHGFIRKLPMRWRTLWFGLGYLALVGIVWLVLDLIYHGQFTFHVWTMHRRATWSFALMMKFVSLLGAYWPLMLAGIALIPLALRQQSFLVPCWYLLLAPLTLFGAGKTGANHNHLMETILAFALVAGTVSGWALRSNAPRLPALLLLSLVTLQGWLALTPPDWYTGELYPSSKNTPERYLEFMRGTPGEILADDASLLLMADKPLRYDDASGMGPVSISGLWDQRGILDDIANHRFSAIMIPVDVETEETDHAGRWSPEVIAAVRDAYQMLYRDRIITYIPK